MKLYAKIDAEKYMTNDGTSVRKGYWELSEKDQYVASRKNIILEKRVPTQTIIIIQ